MVNINNNFSFKEALSFNFKTAKKANTVVGLYAGPSVSRNSEKILKYIKDNNSIVIGSNYNFESIGIKSNYTYIANDFKLVEQDGKLTNDIVIPGRLFSGEHPPKESRKILRKYMKRGLNIFMVGEIGDKTTYSVNKGILKMNEDGSLPYSRLSSAGHGCMLLSMVCRPKRILFVGLDGPTDKTCAEKIMFDGRIQKYGKPQKNANFQQHFTDVILPTIQSRGIQIATFEDVGMYGLNKNEFKIKVI